MFKRFSDKDHIQTDNLVPIITMSTQAEMQMRIIFTQDTFLKICGIGAIHNVRTPQHSNFEYTRLLLYSRIRFSHDHPPTLVTHFQNTINAKRSKNNKRTTGKPL